MNGGANVVRLQFIGDAACVVAENPPVNALSRDVRDGLVVVMGKAATSRVRNIVLCCEGRTFFSGADISELDGPLRGASLLSLLAICEDAPQPIIAAMHGHVFGGGVVIGYCADYRIAARGTVFAMPEINLGLIATFGGTQYLPRLIGVDNAIGLLIDGEVWECEEAMSAGFVDAVAERECLTERAIEFAAGIDTKRPVRASSLGEGDVAAALVKVDETISRVRKAWPGWVAPLATLDALRTGLVKGVEAGLQREAELFEELKASTQSRELRELFFARRRLKRERTDTWLDAKIRGVIGDSYLRDEEAAQRNAIEQINLSKGVTPLYADAVLAENFGWPIWKANVFRHLERRSD